MEQQSQPQSQQQRQEKRRMDLLLNSSGKNKQSESLKEFHNRLGMEMEERGFGVYPEEIYTLKQFYQELLSYSNSNVKYLNYDQNYHYSLTKNIELARIISVNQSLELLNISFFSPNFDFSFLAEALTYNNTLKTIRIYGPRGNTYGPEVIELTTHTNFTTFIHNIGVHKSIKTLVINDVILASPENEFFILEIKELLESSNPTLTTLNLEHMTFHENDNEKVIAKAIEFNTSLENLRLGSLLGREYMEAIRDSMWRNSTLKSIRLTTVHNFRQEIDTEINKNQLLPELIQFLNTKLPFPLPLDKFMFEKIIRFLDEYPKTIKRKEKLLQLQLSRLKEISQIEQDIAQTQIIMQREEGISSSTQTNQIKQLNLKKQKVQFLQYIPHNQQKIKFLQMRKNKIRQELNKNLNPYVTKSFLNEILDTILVSAPTFSPLHVIESILQRKFYIQDAKTRAIIAKNLMEFHKKNKQLDQERDKINLQNIQIQEYNKEFQDFYHKIDDDELRKFYNENIETSVDKYNIEYLNKILSVYRTKKEFHEALLVFFQEFIKYYVYKKQGNEKWYPEMKISIHNFEYVKDVKEDYHLELKWMHPFLVSFLLQYIEMKFPIKFNELPEEYRNKRKYEPVRVSKGEGTVILRNDSDIDFEFDFISFYLNKTFPYFIFIAMLTVFKEKYPKIYDEILESFFDHFQVFFDEKYVIELVSYPKEETSGINRLDGVFEVSAFFHFRTPKYNYSVLKFLDLPDFVNYLSNLKKNFIREYESLPVELTNFKEYEIRNLIDLYDQDYPNPENMKQKLKFLLGEKLYNSIERKQKQQQQQRSKGIQSGNNKRKRQQQQQPQQQQQQQQQQYKDKDKKAKLNQVQIQKQKQKQTQMQTQEPNEKMQKKSQTQKQQQQKQKQKQKQKQTQTQEPNEKMQKKSQTQKQQQQKQKQKQKQTEKISKYYMKKEVEIVVENQEKTVTVNYPIDFESKRTKRFNEDEIKQIYPLLRKFQNNRYTFNIKDGQITNLDAKITRNNLFPGFFISTETTTTSSSG
jgi:flagellar biosynthesis GTPase FlhF